MHSSVSSVSRMYMVCTLVCYNSTSTWISKPIGMVCDVPWLRPKEYDFGGIQESMIDFEVSTSPATLLYDCPAPTPLPGKLMQSAIAMRRPPPCGPPSLSCQLHSARRQDANLGRGTRGVQVRPLCSDNCPPMGCWLGDLSTDQE